jgi:hypothetical protein
MPTWVLALFALFAAVVPAGVFFTASFLNYGYQGYGTGPALYGAPGPLLGAGLPVLLVAGGYWAVRRYRGKKTS